MQIMDAFWLLMICVEIVSLMKGSSVTVVDPANGSTILLYAGMTDAVMDLHVP